MSFCRHLRHLKTDDFSLFWLDGDSHTHGLTLRVLEALHLVELDVREPSVGLNVPLQEARVLESRLPPQEDHPTGDRGAMNPQEVRHSPLMDLRAEQEPEAEVQLPLLLPKARVEGGARERTPALRASIAGDEVSVR